MTLVGLRGIHHEASGRRGRRAVGYRLPRAHAPLNLHAPSKPRPREEVNAVEDRRWLPSGPRHRHQIVHLAELPRLDVVEPADLVPAAAGEAGIHRRRDAKLVVVRRSHCQIVGHGEVAIHGPVVVDRQRRPRPDLVIHRHRALPVERLRAVEAFQGIVAIVQAGRRSSTKVPVRQRPAFAVGGQIRGTEDAVRLQVTRTRITGPKEAVVPRSVRLHGYTLDGLNERIPIVPLRRGPGGIPAKRSLHRGPAGAKQIVGAPKPRIEILPIRHLPHLRVAACGHEITGPERLGIRHSAEGVEPQPQVQGQPPVGPPILHEGPIERRVARPPDGGGKNRDRLGHLVPEGVLHALIDHVGVFRTRVPPRVYSEELMGEAGLEGMRPGDVGHRKPLVVHAALESDAIATIVGGERVCGSDARAVGDARSCVVDTDVALRDSRRCHALDIESRHNRRRSRLK